MSPKSYYIGLDVALKNTGVVVYSRFKKRIEYATCIQTEDRSKELGIYVAEDYARRVRQLCAKIDLVLLQYPPQRIFAELPHGGAKSAKAAASMLLSAGGLTGFFFARDLFLQSVTPYEVKRLVRPKGKVEKSEVEALVRVIFGGVFLDDFKKSESEHIADAAGALIAGMRKLKPTRNEPASP